MKRFLFLMLFFFVGIVMPTYNTAFAVVGYDKAMENIGGQPNVYDTSKEREYFQKLEKKFFEKYPNGNFTGAQYNKEVMIPFLDFTSELQKTDHDGFLKF